MYWYNKITPGFHQLHTWKPGVIHSMFQFLFLGESPLPEVIYVVLNLYPNIFVLIIKNNKSLKLLQWFVVLKYFMLYNVEKLWGMTNDEITFIR